jgi:hypothetical protein
MASRLLSHAHGSGHVHRIVILPQVSLQLLELMHLIGCRSLLVLN